MQRDQILKSARPSIPIIIEENAVSDQERFQNQVLRPILKLQNDLLVQLFQSYIARRKGVYHQLTLPKKEAYIADAIQKDHSFRNLLVGCIIGQLTVEEYGLFATHERELTRRMMDMCVKRLQDQLLKIVSSQ